LICFGGSDIHNLSLQAAKAVWESQKFEEIHIVLGSAFAFYQNLRTFVRDKPAIYLHQNLSAQTMCDLMLHCELAIVPASGIAYEVLAAKMIWWGGYYVDNQTAIYKGFKEIPNLMTDLGDFRVALESKILNELAFEIAKTNFSSFAIEVRSKENISNIFRKICLYKY
jgi:spore coat polysaccharide biosynthesis predicted glycosyltransferase SpsG